MSRPQYQSPQQQNNIHDDVDALYDEIRQLAYKPLNQYPDFQSRQSASHHLLRPGVNTRAPSLEQQSRGVRFTEQPEIRVFVREYKTQSRQPRAQIQYQHQPLYEQRQYQHQPQSQYQYQQQAPLSIESRQTVSNPYVNTFEDVKKVDIDEYFKLLTKYREQELSRPRQRKSVLI